MMKTLAILLLAALPFGLRAQVVTVEPALPAAFEGHCAASYNRFVPLLMATHVFGGFDGTTYLNDNRWFENVGGNCTPWLAAAPMPTARAYAVAAQGPAKLLYVIGGQNTSGKLAVVEIYNPVTDTWSTGSPMPQALSHAGAAYMGGKIYVAGGFTSAGLLSNAVYAYDPLANTWSTLASLPAARAGLTLCTAFNGSLGAMRLFAVGGTTNILTLAGTTLNTEYNPVTNTWTARAAMPTARYMHGAAGDYTGAAGSLNVGRVHVFGGRNGASVLGNYEWYDVMLNTWTSATLSPAPVACYGLSMHTYLYIAGGCLSDAVTFLGGNTGSGLLTQHLRLTIMFALPQQQHNLWVTPVSPTAVDVSWEVAPDESLATLWLEKADDGAAFRPISDEWDATKGNKHRFTQRDAHLWQGVNRYRLALRHQDGTVTFSKEEAWLAQQPAWTAEIGPVPAADAATLTVQGLEPLQDIEWTALDLKGAVIATGAFSADQAGAAALALETSGWPAGTCWVRVASGSRAEVLKVVVVH